MAIIANLNFPDVTEVEIGRAIVKLAAFSVPPTAFAFLEQAENAPTFPQSKVSSPFVMQGAFTDEGKYLEPTVGQIWPR